MIYSWSCRYGDGRADLYGINRDVPTSPFLHRATGAWRTPFAVRSNVTM
jgi:hypothetical protein